MLRDRKPVPSGGGHQGKLSNLKHLVSISEKEKGKGVLRRSEWAPCERKGVT